MVLCNAVIFPFLFDSEDKVPKNIKIYFKIIKNIFLIRDR